MKIVFIGTSHGVPEASRRCSSAMLEIGDKRYFVDMGTDPMPDLITRHIHPDSVKGIFITHMHGDHTNGLPAFLELSSWYFKNTMPTVCLPEPMDKTVEALRVWMKCNQTTMKDFTFMPVKEGVFYEDDTIRVTAYRTKHIAESYSFLIEAEGKRVFFSGDLWPDGKGADFATQVLDEPLDLAVCEGGHFEATHYLPIFENCANLKALCINHYTEYFLAETIQLVDALKDKIPVCRVQDGTEIII